MSAAAPVMRLSIDPGSAERDLARLVLTLVELVRRLRPASRPSCRPCSLRCRLSRSLLCWPSCRLAAALLPVIRLLPECPRPVFLARKALL